MPQGSHIFGGKDLKMVKADSHRFHLRYLLGVPDEWEGHEGDVMIVSQDNPYEMIFAGITPSGIVITEKVRIEGTEPAAYLGGLIDDDTIVVIGPPNSKRIAVSDQFLKRAGGNITGDITFDPGVTIDGIDLSELYNLFFNKNNLMSPEIVNGEVVFNGYVTFNGGTNLVGGGTGVTKFKQLTDVPNSYLGQAGKIPVVKGDETGLEFQTVSGVSINFDAEFFTLTSGQISSKSIVLSNSPANPQSIIVHVAYGLPGIYGIDFTVSGNTVSWSGKEWDGILSTGDRLSICYAY